MAHKDNEYFGLSLCILVMFIYAFMYSYYVYGLGLHLCVCKKQPEISKNKKSSIFDIKTRSMTLNIVELHY